MSVPLLDDVKRFLHALEATQQEQLELFGKRWHALTNARTDELFGLAETEAALTERTRSSVGERNRILQQAGRGGLPTESILELVTALGGDDRDALEGRIESARRRSLSIRRESWVHWIVIHRSLSHYAELLNLIAHCGRKAPTYDDQSHRHSTGGAILDASI